MPPRSMPPRRSIRVGRLQGKEHHVTLLRIEGCTFGDALRKMRSCSSRERPRQESIFFLAPNAAVLRVRLFLRLHFLASRARRCTRTADTLVRFVHCASQRPTRAQTVQRAAQRRPTLV